MLNKQQIELVNSSLPWESWTDYHGARLGNPSGRCYGIPTSQAVATEQAFGLVGKSVVELGCNEGAHTISLCKFGANVTAVDAKPLGLAFTALRCSCYGVTPKLILLDVDREPVPPADIYYHVGVLYHLTRPELHLRNVLNAAGSGLALGTHYAPSGQPERRHEPGSQYPLAGMSDYALWLPRATIIGMLSDWGAVTVVDDLPDAPAGPWLFATVEKR